MARPCSPDTVPTTSGIYSIWCIHSNIHTENIATELGQPTYWEECIYIGQATNLRNRINQHYLLLKYLKSAGDMKVKYKEFPPDQLNQVEAFMIRELNPKLNFIGLPHARAIPFTNEAIDKILKKKP